MPLFTDVMPKDFSEIIGQDAVISSIKNIVNIAKNSNETIPHILFSGPPGCGKTITAYAIARSLFGDNWRKNFVEFNASDKRGIDVVRNEIKTLSEVRGRRIIFLDEFDGFTSDAQDALRAIMQPTHKLTTSFILSVNKPYLVSDAIRSRCVEYNFSALKPDDQRNILLSVFKKKNILLDAKTPAEVSQIKDGIEVLIRESHGDMRKALNIVEKIISENKTISTKEVIFHQKTQVIPQSIESAISGNIEKAISLMEDALILSNYNSIQIIEDIYTTIKNTVSDAELRAFLYIKLSDTEDRCRRGGTPIIHLCAFLSWAYIAPQIERKTLIASKTV